MPLNTDQRLALSTHVTRDRIEVLLKRLIQLKEEAQRKADFYPSISRLSVESSRSAAAQAIRSAIKTIDQLDHVIKLDNQLLDEWTEESTINPDLAA